MTGITIIFLLSSVLSADGSGEEHDYEENYEDYEVIFYWLKSKTVVK